MRIAVDAMGGDYGPEEIIRGVAVALEAKEDLQVLLVGPEDLELEINSFPVPLRARIELVPATEVIGMGEQPGHALRRKRNASVVIAARLVKEGKAAGFISAGNTGAAMGAALLQMGRITGVERPAIASPLPTSKGMALLVDAGANADAKPSYLLQFALMGAIYAESVFGIKNPRVGLLNIGSEPEKGNELSQKAFLLLEKAPLNFIGNIEGRGLPAGEADVIVCDGFVGNVVLKLVEGLAYSLFAMLREQLAASFRTRLGAALALPAFHSIKTKLDYKEYGGAPLLGLNGICIISHGSSDATAIKNAIGAAVNAVENDINNQIANKLQGLMEG